MRPLYQVEPHNKEPWDDVAMTKMVGKVDGFVKVKPQEERSPFLNNQDDRREDAPCTVAKSDGREEATSSPSPEESPDACRNSRYVDKIAVRDSPAVVAVTDGVLLESTNDTFVLLDAIKPAKDEAFLIYCELAAFLKTPTPTRDREARVENDGVGEVLLEEAKKVYSGIETSLKGLNDGIMLYVQKAKRSANGIEDPVLLEAFLVYSELNTFLQGHLQPAIDQATEVLQSAGSITTVEIARTVDLSRGIISQTAETAFTGMTRAGGLAANVLGPVANGITEKLNEDPAVAEARLMLAGAAFPTMPALHEDASLSETKEAPFDETTSKDSSIGRLARKTPEDHAWTANHIKANEAINDSKSVRKATLDTLDAMGTESSIVGLARTTTEGHAWTVNQIKADVAIYDSKSVRKDALDALDAMGAGKSLAKGHPLLPKRTDYVQAYT